jgi:hypothetical protein
MEKAVDWVVDAGFDATKRLEGNLIPSAILFVTVASSVHRKP